MISENEKRSYLQVMTYLAYTDGNFSKEEQAAIDIAASNLNIASKEVTSIIDEVKNGKSLDAILAEITTESTKRTLIYELIILCFVDGNYSDEEKKEIREIATKMSIPLTQIAELEKLISQYIEVSNKIRKALEG